MKDYEKEVLQRLSLGRAEVLSRAEYYASTICSFSPVVVWRPDSKLTIGVTKHLVLYVNAAWFLKSGQVDTVQKIAGILVHEAEHPLRGIERMEALPNQELANYAGDVAINCNVREEGWELPSGGVYPETYGLPSGKSLEWYYNELTSRCQKIKAGISQLTGSSMKDEGKGKGKSSGKGSGSDDQQGDGWKPGIAAGACGGVGGNSLDPDLEAELDGEHGKSDAEVEAIRRQTLEDIENHMAVHGRGSVPGRFRELVKTKIKPADVNWRTLLRQVFRRSVAAMQAGGRTYSISRPSMSSAFTGALMSGLVDRPLNIAAIIDTSMSMGTKQLTDAHSEVFHMIRKSGVGQIWLVHADVEVHMCQRVKARDIPKMPFMGRGGTDFRLAFHKVQRLRPRPNLVVYLTDGDGVAPPRPPRDMSVIWVIVKTQYARKPAHWGRVVVCASNQALQEPVLPS